MKKTAFILSVLLVLIVLAISPAWPLVYNKLLVHGASDAYSQLLFESLNGEYSIHIDREFKTDVKEHERKEIFQIQPGKHLVQIKRKSEVENFYYVLERTLEFYPSSQVEIVWEAGPTLESSSGNIKYFVGIVKPGASEVYVQTSPSEARVEFDSKYSSGKLFEVTDIRTHTLRVSNGKGFEEYVTKVNLRNESNKKVLENLRLIIEVYLYKSPF